MILRNALLVSTVFASLAAVACGGTDDGSGGSGAGSSSGGSTSSSGGSTSSSGGMGSTGGGMAQGGGGMGQGGTGQGGTAQGGGGMGQGGSGMGGGGGQGGGTTMAVCGDYLVTGGETCDDGGTMAGDGCDAMCMIEPYVCQDGVVDPGEECDDMNNMTGDGCDASCMLEAGDCASAVDMNDTTVVTIVGNVTSYDGDSTGSTLIDYGMPGCGDTVTSPTVLHAYTIPATGAYNFKTVDPMMGAMDDTVMWAYFDCLTANSNELVCNDDIGGGVYYSQFEGTLEAGRTIYIAIAGYGGDAGPYRLEITQLSVCGDGTVDDGELCDDGNTMPGDGCNQFCDYELNQIEAEMNGTSMTANSMMQGYLLGSINPTNDEDWFEITMPAGMTTLTAAFFPSPTGNACNQGDTTMLGDVDSELEILESDGTTSVATDDGSLYCAQVQGTALTAGNTYYVRAAASTQFCAGCIFDYQLLLTATP
ncbi:MAG: DUF4215 domain-containing protein [Polyangiaceae bacterium]